MLTELGIQVECPADRAEAECPLGFVIQFCKDNAGSELFFLPLNVAAEYSDKVARCRNHEDGMIK